MANSEKMKTMIGGQALLEGIMMRGPDKDSVVLRKQEGLDVQVTPRKTRKKGSILTWPLIRGVVNFFDAQLTGIKAISKSAEDTVDEEPGRFEKWLEKKIGSEKMNKLLMSVAMVIALGFSVLLFFVVPMLVGSLFEKIVNSLLVQNLIEGLIRIIIFVAYMIIIASIPDMKRVYGYHGAEHKTIRCYEAKLPLTVDNVRPMSRLHPRCGTSFLLIIVIISILLFSVATSVLIAVWPQVKDLQYYQLIKIGFKLLLIPLVVSIGYEFNRIVGKHDNFLTRALSAPGMWFQHMTTKEPDDEMIEVAIAALEAVIPDEEGADKW